MIKRVTWHCYAFLAGVLMTLSPLIDYAQIKAESGYLQASNWNFEASRLPLSGQWMFFDHKLVSPDACDKEHGTLSNFPCLWKSESDDGIGYGTYHLKVIIADTIQQLELEIPQIYNCYTLWINGLPIASAGKVGTSHHDTMPQWKYQTTPFNVNNDTLDIVLQVANFHHFKGGVKDPIYLGSPQLISKHKLLALGSNMVEIILLFITGAVFLAYYFTHRNKKVILYFALFSLTWSVRAMFSNLYPITAWFPEFDWNTLLRIEYITLFSAVVWSVLFVNTLFKNIKRQIFTYMLVGVNAFFGLFTLITMPYTFSRWVEVYLAVAAIGVLYCVVIIIRGIMYEQKGAWLLVISLLFGVVVFGYEIIAYGSSHYNYVVLHTGYILIFVMITLSLLIHMDIIKARIGGSEILTYHDMVGRNGK